MGYYAMGFYEKKLYGWDNSLPERQFSPAFIYNQLSGGVMDKGGRIEDALKLVTQEGCAVMSVMPYKEDDCSALPSIEQYINAMFYRVDQYVQIFPRGLSHPLSDAVVDTIKGILAGGNIVIVEIPVFNSFRYPSKSAWDYRNGKPYFYNPKGGGALSYQVICIMGYDDDIGGFLIRNSWGTDWATDGDAYISYDFFKEYALEAWRIVAFSNHNVEDYITFRVDCPRRRSISVWFGNEIGRERQIFGYLSADATDGRSGIEMAVDVTDDLKDSPSTKRWYLRVLNNSGDGTDATIDRFSLHVNSDEYHSLDVPASIPDDSEKKVYVELPEEWNIYIDSSCYEGVAPLKVDLAVCGNYDENEVSSYLWDFDGDGKVDTVTETPSVTWTYRNKGRYCPCVILTLLSGETEEATCRKEIVVEAESGGDAKPHKPSIVYPLSGTLVSWDTEVKSSCFSSDCNTTHKMSHWIFEVNGVRVFDRLVKCRAFLESLPLVFVGIKPLDRCDVRVRYLDDRNNWSHWSDVVGFSIADFEDFDRDGVPDSCEYRGYVDLNRNGVDDRSEGYKIVTLDGGPVGIRAKRGCIDAVYVKDVSDVSLLLMVVSNIEGDRASITFLTSSQIGIVDPFEEVVQSKSVRAVGSFEILDGGMYDVDGAKNGRIVVCLKTLGKGLAVSGGGCSICPANIDIGIPLLIGVVLLSYAVRRLLRTVRKE